MRFLRLSIMLLILSSVVLLNIDPVAGQGDGADDDDSIEHFLIVHDGNMYGTRLFIPSSYEEDGDPLPLIIAFHPSGGTGEAMARLSQFDVFGEEDNVLVAYPTSQFGYWDYGYGLPEWAAVKNVLDDVGFAEKLYDYLLETYNVDVTQVYLVGFSNGSRMVMRMACEHSEWFAGAAIVAAGMTSEVAAICPATAQLPVYFQQGTDDLLVPWEGKPLRDGGNIIGYAYAAPDTVTFWVLQNGCALEPIVNDVPDINEEDAISIRRARFEDCTSGYPVEFYAVLGGGHSWIAAPSLITTDYVPSGDTSTYIWEFFGLAGEVE